MLLWINSVTLKVGRRSQGKLGQQLSLEPLVQPITWSRVVTNATAGQGQVTNPASSSISGTAGTGGSSLWKTRITAASETGRAAVLALGPRDPAAQQLNLPALGQGAAVALCPVQEQRSSLAPALLPHPQTPEPQLHLSFPPPAPSWRNGEPGEALPCPGHAVLSPGSPGPCGEGSGSQSH